MTPLQHKQVLHQIIKLLSRDRRKKIRMGTFINMTFEARAFVRKASRQIENERREMKRMKWSKNKNGNMVHGVYVISKLNPLPFKKKEGIKYWLGREDDDGYFTIGLGTFPDIETAKYIVYLLTKKQ